MGFMLRELRQKRGLTAQQMVARLGVKEDRYRKWEAGVNGMPLDYAMQACSILRCSLDELAGRVIPALSEDEQRLLDLYRACAPEAQGYFLNFAEITAATFPRE